jgi:hypothetical protein
MEFPIVEGVAIPESRPRRPAADPPNAFIDTVDIARLTDLFGRSCA